MLTRREQWIVMITAAALAVLAYDRLLLTPMLARADQRTVQRQQLADELNAQQHLLRLRRELMPRWRELANAHMADDPALAESRILHAVRTWSRDSGLNLTAVTPERPAVKAELCPIVVSISGHGPIEAVARFLYKMDHAAMPIRAERVRMAGQQDRDNLSVEIRLTTLYRNETAEGRRSTLSIHDSPADVALAEVAR